MMPEVGPVRVVSSFFLREEHVAGAFLYLFAYRFTSVSFVVGDDGPLCSDTRLWFQIGDISHETYHQLWR